MSNFVTSRANFLNRLIKSNLMDKKLQNPGFDNEAFKEIQKHRRNIKGEYKNVNRNSIDFARIMKRLRNKNPRDTSKITVRPIIPKSNVRLAKKAISGIKGKAYKPKPKYPNPKGNKKEFELFMKYLNNLNKMNKKKSETTRTASTRKKQTMHAAKKKELARLHTRKMAKSVVDKAKKHTHSMR